MRLLCVALVLLSLTRPVRAKEVRVPAPDPNPRSYQDPWKKAISSLEEGDVVYVGKEVYHLGKRIGQDAKGRTALVFMDADSPEPCVIKFEYYPTASTDNAGLSTEYTVLKSLEQAGFPVAKARWLDPEGHVLRQEFHPGLTLFKYFQTIFPNLSREEKVRVLSKIDGLLRSLGEKSLFTSDLHRHNILISPETLELTIVDPGHVIPWAGGSLVLDTEHRMSYESPGVWELFQEVHQSADCKSGLGALK